VLTISYQKDATSKCKAISGDKSLGEYAATGKVTSGTAKQMVGGAAGGSACIYSKGSATIVKNLGAFKV
jgi:hypothetical protein